MAAAASAAHLVTNAAEHRAVLDPVRRLSREHVRTTILPVDDVGSVPIDELVGALTTETRLVSVMLANNEVGTISDLTSVGMTCQSKGVALHSDAAQALGKIPIDLSSLPVDLMSFSAHKLHGPQGIGALFVRRGERRVPLRPLLEGGGHESGLRSGTLPVALIAGFGEAVRLASARMEVDSVQMACLRDRLWSRLESIPGIRWNGPPPAGRLPNNLNVSFEGIDGDALLVRVDQMGLNVSSGAACSSTNPEPSHVLRAIGLSESMARASLRFGLSRFTTEDEVDRAALIVSDAVASLRAVRRGG
jgi:cysteine desulfurase